MSRDIDLLLARDPVLWRHFERIDDVEGAATLSAAFDALEHTGE